MLHYTHSVATSNDERRSRWTSWYRQNRVSQRSGKSSRCHGLRVQLLRTNGLSSMSAHILSDFVAFEKFTPILKTYRVSVAKSFFAVLDFSFPYCRLKVCLKLLLITICLLINCFLLILTFFFSWTMPFIAAAMFSSVYRQHLQRPRAGWSMGLLRWVQSYLCRSAVGRRGPGEMHPGRNQEQENYV